MVKLLTIGQIRDSHANATVIDALQSNKEIELYFVGSGNSVPALQEHCRINNSERVTFLGRYKKEEEASIVEGYSMINSFMDHDINSDSLLTNRLYLSAILRKPLLVRGGTYQAEVVSKYGLGLVVNDAKNLADDIMNYFEGIDWNQYDSNCRRFLNEVKTENNHWGSSMLSFVNS